MTKTNKSTTKKLTLGEFHKQVDENQKKKEKEKQISIVKQQLQIRGLGLASEPVSSATGFDEKAELANIMLEIEKLTPSLTNNGLKKEKISDTLSGDNIQNASDLVSVFEQLKKQYRDAKSCLEEYKKFLRRFSETDLIKLTVKERSIDELASLLTDSNYCLQTENARIAFIITVAEMLCKRFQNEPPISSQQRIRNLSFLSQMNSANKPAHFFDASIREKAVEALQQVLFSIDSLIDINDKLATSEDLGPFKKVFEVETEIKTLIQNIISSPQRRKEM